MSSTWRPHPPPSLPKARRCQVVSQHKLRAPCSQPPTPLPPVAILLTAALLLPPEPRTRPAQPPAPEHNFCSSVTQIALALRPTNNYPPPPKKKDSLKPECVLPSVSPADREDHKTSDRSGVARAPSRTADRFPAAKIPDTHVAISKDGFGNRHARTHRQRDHVSRTIKRKRNRKFSKICLTNEYPASAGTRPGPWRCTHANY